eukprot:m.403973 g.403973  ORF g.403973 m.403973 type:complete len:272 (-) comp16790_c1_seq15:20209-21024(-)
MYLAVQPVYIYLQIHANINSACVCHQELQLSSVHLALLRISGICSADRGDWRSTEVTWAQERAAAPWWSMAAVHNHRTVAGPTSSSRHESIATNAGSRCACSRLLAEAATHSQVSPSLELKRHPLRFGGGARCVRDVWTQGAWSPQSTVVALHTLCVSATWLSHRRKIHGDRHSHYTQHPPTRSHPHHVSSPLRRSSSLTHKVCIGHFLDVSFSAQHVPVPASARRVVTLGPGLATSAAQRKASFRHDSPGELDGPPIPHRSPRLCRILSL